MLYVLVWVPVLASATLVAMYVIAGSRVAFKIAGVAVFVVAAYLQFFTSHSLLGMLVQVALALILALWWRMFTVA